MDRNFLECYNTELQHIRLMAGEFAKEFPKIAGRLALDPDGKEICPDPYVERLLEGFAYLTARVQVKLDAEFPRFTQSLLETVFPQYLAPTPSMAVVRFDPDLASKSLIGGFVIPRDTTIRTRASKGDSTRCVYRTAHEIKLWPVEIVQASYFDRNLHSLGLPPEAGAKAAISIQLEATADLNFSEIGLDSLEIFLRGSDSLPALLMEHWVADSEGLWVRDSSVAGSPWAALPSGSVRLIGMENHEALLPPAPNTFEGYRLLLEYFSFPQRFLFFKLLNLANYTRELKSKRLEIAFALRKVDTEIGPKINSSLFALNCTPVVNLFPQKADRIELNDRSSEFHVVVDRTRPTDFEVYQIQSVTGYGATSGEQQEFRSFYRSGDSDSKNTAYFTTHRKMRNPTEREKRFGKLSAYSGCEVYISLADASSAPYRSGLEQLGVSVLCTNRHLPVSMSQGDRSAQFAVEVNGPIKSITCLSGPTSPRPSFATGETAWRIISHLSLNYLSLTESSGKNDAGALCQMLKLYVDPEDRSAQKQIDGILSVQSRPVLRRVPSLGMVAFARGLEITVNFDEDAFAGTGVFILGSVLEQFFARHVAINSFTETVICSKQRGEILRWPTRTGKKILQ